MDFGLRLHPWPWQIFLLLLVFKAPSALLTSILCVLWNTTSLTQDFLGKDRYNPLPFNLSLRPCMTTTTYFAMLTKWLFPRHRDWAWSIYSIIIVSIFHVAGLYMNDKVWNYPNLFLIINLGINPFVRKTRTNDLLETHNQFKGMTSVSRACFINDVLWEHLAEKQPYQSKMLSCCHQHQLQVSWGVVIWWFI